MGMMQIWWCARLERSHCERDEREGIGHGIVERNKQSGN